MQLNLSIFKHTLSINKPGIEAKQTGRKSGCFQSKSNQKFSKTDLTATVERN